MRPNLQPLQPTHAPVSTALGASRIASGRVISVAICVMATAAFATLASAPQSTHGATLADKQAQAAELDEQVRTLEHRYDALQERFRGAQYTLDEIRSDVADAREQVAATRRDLRRAKGRLATRAGAIYRSGESEDLAQLASAGSISSFFDRIDTIRRVGDQDAFVLVRVEQLNASVEEKERRLRTAKVRAERAAATARKAKDAMAEVLDERQAKLASVNADIRAIMEAQRRAEAARAAAAARESAALASVTDQAGDAPSSGGGDGGSSSSGGDSGGDGDGGGSSVSVPLPPASGSAAGAANAAMSKLGSPYVWAGSGPDTFDCSGLVMWAFAQAGRPGLPHSTYALVGMGVDVPLDQLQVGDLVFPSHNGHVGIYVGGGSFVHAPSSGDVVKVTSMGDYSISHARRL